MINFTTKNNKLCNFSKDFQDYQTVNLQITRHRDEFQKKTLSIHYYIRNLKFSIQFIIIDILFQSQLDRGPGLVYQYI